MRTIKRLRTLILTLLLVPILAVPALAVEDDSQFSDVPEDADYSDAVNWAAENGLINGYADGHFGVNDNVARQQLAAILYRAEGSPTAYGTIRFSDVEAGAYYETAVKWAAKNGLINGYTNECFGVGDGITRQQVITILWRWAGSPKASAEAYTDKKDISKYARTAVDWSRANNIMEAREDGSFDPLTPATRVEIVSALYRYRLLLRYPTD